MKLICLSIYHIKIQRKTSKKSFISVSSNNIETRIFMRFTNYEHANEGT